MTSRARRLVRSGKEPRDTMRPLVWQEAKKTTKHCPPRRSPLKHPLKMIKKLSSRLLYYHGTSGMNVTVFPTWDAYFRQLLEAPGKEITIDSGRGEYVIDIEPARICSRILSVRNQISKEWEKDLLAVLQMKKSIMHSYREREARRNLEAQAELESRRVEKKEKEGDKDIEGLKEERKGTVKGESKWVRVAPLMSSATTPGFDRQPLFFLESDPYDDSGLVASPLRKSSFDLLLLLATREALRRILDHKKVNWEVRSDNENSAAKSAVLNASQISFLKQFYEERREKYFLGRYRRYGLADDFVEELMTHPPRMTTMIRRKEKIPVLLDPAAIAEAVLDKRGEVATEWAKEASLFPGEHAEIQKLQLNRMMGL
uniref:Uncharacterized protein n=1 Tax=Corethron hystrix TaxID=216773 RepID=A0A7S1FN44_9STRA|mmetsp:Transcript_15058/g.33593  ORF Transcript_15058/g.33593 Transcript_15058/m.33593 type:complete len:372 (+) Transcript_15058:371-1486(+)